MIIAACGVGGLVMIIFFTIMLIHRIKKSNEGSYLVPWEAARTAGGLSYVGKTKRQSKIVFANFSSLDDSCTTSAMNSACDERLPDAVQSLTPFLQRKGLNFSDPKNVHIKNFDVL